MGKLELLWGRVEKIKILLGKIKKICSGVA